MAEVAHDEANLLEAIRRLGLDPSAMSKRTLAEISKVEGALAEMAREAQRARKIAEDNAPTIKAIAARSGISRATFYNNANLDAYARNRAAELFPDKNEEESLRAQLKSAKDDIRRMQERDGMIVLLKFKVDQLESEVKTLEEDLERERTAHFDELRLMKMRLDSAGAVKVVAKRPKGGLNA